MRMRFPDAAIPLAALVALLVSVGCTAVQKIPKQEEGPTFLELEVEPETAELYVDGEFRGEVRGWKRGLVPMKPGEHRIKLSADGYMTRRFDITFERGHTHTITLEMERELETFEADAGRGGRTSGIAPPKP